MRIKNVTADLYLRHFVSIAMRDVLVIGACLLREVSSLRAFPLVRKSYRKMLWKREHIMQRRRVDSRYIAAWFSNRPVTIPAGPVNTSAKVVTPR
jgi:hypothetical protein